MGTDYTPLRKLVRPFMLRRLKTDPGLLPELPQDRATRLLPAHPGGPASTPAK